MGARYGALGLVFAGVAALAACSPEWPDPPPRCAVGHLLAPISVNDPATGRAAAVGSGAPSFQSVLRQALTDRRGQGRPPPGAEPPAQAVLALSGGGAWGGFGAGFLQGWRQASDRGEAIPDRPAFDIVTGISTGALIAPFAFINSADADAAVVRLYREADDSKILEERGLFSLLSANGRAGLGPLTDLVRTAIDARFEAIQAAARDGRKLFVGVVDLRDSQFYSIDLSALSLDERIGSRDTRVDCFTRYLVASSAVPIAFDPVNLAVDAPAGTEAVVSGERFYVDGGARLVVYLDLIDRTMRSMAGGAGGPGDASATRMSLFVIMNADLAPDPVERVQPGLFSLANRSSSVVTDQLSRDALAAVLEQGEAAGFRRRYVLAPGDTCSRETGQTFDPAFINCLADYAAQLWQDVAEPWCSGGICPTPSP